MIALDLIVDRVVDFGVRHVTVTGGEPLAQPNVLDLLTALCDRGLTVSLETSGALSVAEVDARVVKVVDFKTPGSAEVSRNLWENTRHLLAHDQVKFVLCSREDYEWARMQCAQYDLHEQVAEVSFSPSYGQLDATQLADWIVADRAPVRMQVQLHKLLWGDEPGR